MKFTFCLTIPSSLTVGYCAHAVFFTNESQQDGPDLSGQWPDAAPNQLEILQKRELKRGLEALVGYLPGGLRRAFLLNCVEGLTTRETATRMALSVAAVKSRVWAAVTFAKASQGKRYRTPRYLAS